MRLIQYTDENGQRRVGKVGDADTVIALKGTDSVYALALRAAAENTSIAALVSEFAGGAETSLLAVIDAGRILTPIDHPVDDAHCIVSGTGLTHLGIGSARDELLARFEQPADTQANPGFELLKQGYLQGKSTQTGIGPQPEWFYRGDGGTLVATGQPLELPDYAADGGDEAELAALYVVDRDGSPCRVGFALANEFTDHRMEKRDSLHLGHSKLRQCALGPELLLGKLPPQVLGEARIRRGDEVIWAENIATGTDHITHALRNLEHHHFKYSQFRRPGDVHVHLLGAAAQSFSAGIQTQIGDVFEIEAAPFGAPLTNPLGPARPLAFTIRQL